MIGEISINKIRDLSLQEQIEQVVMKINTIVYVVNNMWVGDGTEVMDMPCKGKKKGKGRK